MSKKDIEDMFSADIEDQENLDEVNELLEFGKKLSAQNFSKDSNKEAVFNKTIENLNKNKGDIKMVKSKKSRKFNIKVASVAAGFIITASLSQTAFGQSVVSKIVETFSLEHVKVSQEEPSNIESTPVPKELEGKIFDKDGNEIKEFTKDFHGEIYTVDGEKIVSFANKEIVTEKQKEESQLIVKDKKELNQYTSFKVKLPSYLPKGYEFEKATFFKGESGTVKNTDYIDLYFTNKETGKYIFMQQRRASKETAYEAGTEGKVEKVKVNGVDALVYDNTIDWEYNGVIYGMHGRGGATNNELIKIAESIK